MRREAGERVVKARKVRKVMIWESMEVVRGEAEVEDCTSCKAM